MLEDWQHKCRRLTATGLCNAEKIRIVENLRNRFFLNGGRLYVILRSQGAGEGLDQSELREISRCQNVKILCVKRTVANAHANLSRRRHPRAIGRNGMYKRKRRPGLVA